MRLYEHEAKTIFEGMGLAVPRRFGVVRSPSEIDGLAIDGPVMVKAMVLTGGRGKAGGVKRAGDAAEAKEHAAAMLGVEIKGYPVEALLLEAAAGQTGACYLGVTTNPATFNVIVMASAEGGVDIEEVALNRPGAMLKREIPDNDAELAPAVVAEFAAFLAHGLGNQDLEPELADAVAKLYAIYQRFDCRVAEINPLLIDRAGRAIAADAKVVIDDNALYRQGALFEMLGLKESRHDVSELTRDEQRARAAGFPYVDLLPDGAVGDPDKLYVGLVPGGAGYGIFSIDEVVNVGRRHFGGKVVPVNFMDSGGGPSLLRVAEMFHLLMDKEIVDMIVTSRFGGISSCDVFIRGLIQCLRERHRNGQRVLPVCGRMVGTDLPSARTALEKARIETPDALERLWITVGNQKVMVDVIKEGLARGFAFKHGGVAAAV